MPPCGFCGAEGQSKEHLWAGWLGRAILESRAQGGLKTSQQQVERGGRVSSFPNTDVEHTVRMPCEPCDNGWTSELENEVKPFVSASPPDKTIDDGELQVLGYRFARVIGGIVDYSSRTSKDRHAATNDRIDKNRPCADRKRFRTDEDRTRTDEDRTRTDEN